MELKITAADQQGEVQLIEKGELLSAEQWQLGPHSGKALLQAIHRLVVVGAHQVRDIQEITVDLQGVSSSVERLVQITVEGLVFAGIGKGNSQDHVEKST